MTETTPEDTDTDLTVFAIFGLYRDRQLPDMIQATDRADARRQYHDRYPGWLGTTLYVKSLDELVEVSDD